MINDTLEECRGLAWKDGVLFANANRSLALYRLRDTTGDDQFDEVTLLQRKAERPGKRLGKTTGWIHRAALRMKNVKMMGGVNYERIDETGLHVSQGEARENPTVIEADTIVLCSGQLPERSLADALEAQGTSCHVIGGADVAAELDAKRAINQGTLHQLSQHWQ